MKSVFILASTSIIILATALFSKCVDGKQTVMVKVPSGYSGLVIVAADDSIDVSDQVVVDSTGLGRLSMQVFREGFRFRVERENVNVASLCQFSITGNIDTGDGSMAHYVACRVFFSPDEAAKSRDSDADSTGQLVVDLLRQWVDEGRVKTTKERL